MLKRFLALAAMGTLCACYVTVPAYKWNFAMLAPAPSDKLVFSDEFMDIVFSFGDKQISFEIQNKTASGIKLNWDEFSIIYPNGNMSRVVHSGVRLMDRNSPQAPTVIPPGAKISDFLTPSENIHFDYGEWWYSLLFPGKDELLWNDKDISIYAPLEINAVKKEYKFKFHITVTQSGTKQVLKGQQ